MRQHVGWPAGLETRDTVPIRNREKPALPLRTLAAPDIFNRTLLSSKDQSRLTVGLGLRWVASACILHPGPLLGCAPEVFKGIKPGGVAIGPDWLDGIAADNIDAHQLKGLR